MRRNERKQTSNATVRLRFLCDHIDLRFVKNPRKGALGVLAFLSIFIMLI